MRLSGLHPAQIAPSLIGVAGYAAFCRGIAPHLALLEKQVRIFCAGVSLSAQKGRAQHTYELGCCGKKGSVIASITLPSDLTLYTKYYFIS
jgi:hypothetical protein